MQEHFKSQVDQSFSVEKSILQQSPLDPVDQIFFKDNVIKYESHTN